jgi:hypothetical protein
MELLFEQIARMVLFVGSAMLFYRWNYKQWWWETNEGNEND